MKHTAKNPPKRVVVIGANGVIGKALIPALSGIETVALGRHEVDLLQQDAAEKLQAILQPEDAVVMLTAITPDKGKGIEAFQQNITMMRAVCEAASKVDLSHVVYLSSDAVYSFRHMSVTEETPADPQDLYGAMHRAREMMALDCSAPVAILRATLVYSIDDTHNSYGPNRMRRSAKDAGIIKLFGNGEETRDHISVLDVASLIRLVLENRSVGTLNLVSGRSVSYMELAKKVATLFDKPIDIQTSERQNAITHRHFDATQVHKCFPQFVFEELDEGLKKIHQLEQEKVGT